MRAQRTRAELDDEAELYDEAQHCRIDLVTAGLHVCEAPRANERPRADRRALSHTVEHLRGIEEIEKGTQTEGQCQALVVRGDAREPALEDGDPTQVGLFGGREDTQVTRRESVPLDPDLERVREHAQRGPTVV